MKSFRKNHYNFHKHTPKSINLNQKHTQEKKKKVVNSISAILISVVDILS